MNRPKRHTKRRSPASKAKVEKEMPQRLLIQRKEADPRYEDDEISYKISESPDHFAGPVGATQRVAVYDFVGWSTVTTSVTVSDAE